MTTGYRYVAPGTRAWEAKDDGTMQPLHIVCSSMWPGAFRVLYDDGTKGTVGRDRLVDNDGAPL